MKRTMKFAALLAASVVLAACGGHVQAQTLPEVFNAGGSTFSTGELRSFQGVSGSITLTDKAGAVSPAADFPDPSGTVFAKVRTNTDVLKHYYQVPGSNLYLNTRQIYRSWCNFGKTTIIWNTGGNQDFNGDACSIQSGIAGRAQ